MTTFTWVARGNASDVLNELFVCTSIDSSMTACELCVDLLTRLREMLREYCTAPVFKDNVKHIGGRHLEVCIREWVLKM